MLPEAVSRSWRSYLRFSLRGIIVLVLLVGVWLGWFVRGARVQRDDVAAIRRAGGWVAYELEQKNPSVVTWASVPMPGWLVNVIGVDFFSHVTAIGLPPSSSATDLVIANVGRLTRVGFL
jgi:hypothetical protein